MSNAKTLLAMVAFGAFSVVACDNKKNAGIARDGVTADGAVAITGADSGADGANGAWLADAGADDAIGWNQYFSLEQRPDDVLNAYEASYNAMPQGALASLVDAVVLCRVAVDEHAPLPKSKWDRANGRDLLFEATEAGLLTAHAEGPLGNSAFFVRVDDLMLLANSGAKVTWFVRDRDQDRAYPYRESIALGTYDLPRDASVPLHATPPNLTLDCRGAKSADAAQLLLADADRALADAETKATWNPSSDPRPSLRDALGIAADKIRIGEVIAKSEKKMGPWSAREDRLRSIVRRYVAQSEQAFAKISTVPVGVWATVGKSLSVRATEQICPALPKGVDPGSLNDDQRTACGLVIEVRSATKLKFDPNPWGPAYACRMTGDIRIELLTGPGKVDGVCALGVRRGGKWWKSDIELSDTDPTAIVLSAQNYGRAIRVSIDGASVNLAIPPPPP